MRLIVARCEVTYSGRPNAFLPESTRLLMVKEDGAVLDGAVLDGAVLVHADAGGYKPLNSDLSMAVKPVSHSGTEGRLADAQQRIQFSRTTTSSGCTSPRSGARTLAQPRAAAPDPFSTSQLGSGRLSCCMT